MVDNETSAKLPAFGQSCVDLLSQILIVFPRDDEILCDSAHIRSLPGAFSILAQFQALSEIKKAGFPAMSLCWDGGKKRSFDSTVFDRCAQDETHWVIPTEGAERASGGISPGPIRLQGLSRGFPRSGFPTVGGIQSSGDRIVFGLKPTLNCSESNGGSGCREDSRSSDNGACYV